MLTQRGDGIDGVLPPHLPLIAEGWLCLAPFNGQRAKNNSVIVFSLISGHGYKNESSFVAGQARGIGSRRKMLSPAAKETFVQCF